MLFFYISAEYAIVGWLVTYFQESGILPLDLAQIMVPELKKGALLLIRVTG